MEYLDYIPKHLFKIKNKTIKKYGYYQYESFANISYEYNKNIEQIKQNETSKFTIESFRRCILINRNKYQKNKNKNFLDDENLIINEYVFKDIHGHTNKQNLFKDINLFQLRQNFKHCPFDKIKDFCIKNKNL